MNVGVDDILAALIMSLIMLRRLETLSVQASDNPGVSAANFAAWRNLALSAYNLGALACLAKVVLNIAWFFAWRNSQNPWPLRLGGLGFFVAWVVVLVVVWRRATEARVLRQQLGIQSR